MYKVLVVDDEKPGREMLLYLIDWNKTDFKIVDVAKNGKEALQKYKEIKPDLIITDIQMPVMDGLSLIREIRKHNETQKFIILSCHEDFNYARQAIKMGVTDYLIKDLLTPEDLYGTLTKIREDFKEHDTKLSKSSSVNIKSINDEEFIEQYRNITVKNLIFKTNTASDINSCISKFKLNLNSNNYVVMCLSIDDYFKTFLKLSYEDQNSKIQNIVRLTNSILRSESGGECIYNSNNNFIAIVCINDTNSKLSIMNDYYSISENIKRVILHQVNLSITIGISRHFNSLLEINTQYLEALGVIKYRLFLGNGKTILYNYSNYSPIDISPEMLEEKFKRIQLFMENSDINNLTSEITDIYNGNVNGFIQYNYLNFINSRLFDIIIILMNYYKISYSEMFSLNYIPFTTINNYETVNEMSEWFKNIFIKLINSIIQSKNNHYSKTVNDTIKYIKKNYKSNELCLSVLSKALSLHKVYLCRIFKQETGKNLGPYILKLRIEEAKRLLNTTDNRLYDISEMVGFTNQQQFSLTFKKCTGESPNKFRDKGL